MVRDERLELADERGVAAQLELGVDPLLDRREPELVEPRSLDLEARLVAEVGERRAAPELERAAQRLGALGRRLREGLLPQALEARRGRSTRDRRRARSRAGG